MGRLRASTAQSEVDREIALLVEDARRSLEAAVGKARSSRRTAGPRARRVERDLGRALRCLDDVSSISSPFADPGEISEEERNRLARVKREEERLLKLAEKRQAERTQGEVNV